MMPKDGKMKCSCGSTQSEGKITEKKKKRDEALTIAAVRGLRQRQKTVFWEGGSYEREFTAQTYG